MKKGLGILALLALAGFVYSKSKIPAAPQGETPEQKAAREKAEAEKNTARTAYIKRLNDEYTGTFETLNELPNIERGTRFTAVYTIVNGIMGVYYAADNNFIFIPINELKVLQEPDGLKNPETSTTTKLPTDSGGVTTTGGSGGYGGIGRRPIFFKTQLNV